MPPENLVNEGATEGAAFAGAAYRINVKFTSLLNYLDGFDTFQLNTLKQKVKKMTLHIGKFAVCAKTNSGNAG